MSSLCLALSCIFILEGILNHSISPSVKWDNGSIYWRGLSHSSNRIQNILLNKYKLPSPDFKVTSADSKLMCFKNTFHVILFSKEKIFAFMKTHDYKWMHKTNELNKPAFPYLKTANSLKYDIASLLSHSHCCVQYTACPKVYKLSKRMSFQGM